MAPEFKDIQHIVLSVRKEKIESYTTLLQFGVLLESQIGQSMGVFLTSLPDFDMNYIVDRIQTIFLDGSAIDDMETLFTNSSPVLALSAAMPGLAGAIFRKNSLHAALRTADSKNVLAGQTNSQILVCLKLFNMIAVEKGPGLLEKGGIFSGSALLDFFTPQSQLRQNIAHIEVRRSSIDAESFWSLLDPSLNYHLKISLI